MFGRTVLRVEPRLGGLKVVSAKPPHSDWVGKTFPWSRTRVLNSRVLVVDESGNPARDSSGALLSVWLLRDTMHWIAVRASKRALLREIDSGSLERVFVFRGRRFEKGLMLVFAAMALTALVGAVLPFLGRSIVFPLGPTPTTLDIAKVVVMWALFALAPVIGLLVGWRSSWSPVRAVRFGPHTMFITTADDDTFETPYSSIATMRTEFSGWRIRKTDGCSTFLPPEFGLFPVLDALADHLDPSRREREARSFRRMLIRASLLWALGTLGVGVAMYTTGAPPPRTLAANPLLNTILYTVVAMLAPLALMGLAAWAEAWGKPLIFRLFERRARGKSKRRRIDAASAGHTL